MEFKERNVNDRHLKDVLVFTEVHTSYIYQILRFADDAQYSAFRQAYQGPVHKLKGYRVASIFCGMDRKPEVHSQAEANELVDAIKKGMKEVMKHYTTHYRRDMDKYKTYEN